MIKDHCPDHTETCERLASLESKAPNGSKFVTYKWLIGTIASLTGAIIAVAFSINALFSKNLEAKVDRDIFDTLGCTVNEMKTTINKNDEILRIVEKNQIRYMERMNIPPIKREKKE
jgi:hypothetical protein